MYVFSRQINIKKTQIFFLDLLLYFGNRPTLETFWTWKVYNCWTAKVKWKKETSLIYNILWLLNSPNRKHILISNHKFYKDAGPSTIIMPYILHVQHNMMFLIYYLLRLIQKSDSTIPYFTIASETNKND